MLLQTCVILCDGELPVFEARACRLADPPHLLSAQQPPSESLTSCRFGKSNTRDGAESKFLLVQTSSANIETQNVEASMENDEFETQDLLEKTSLQHRKENKRPSLWKALLGTSFFSILNCVLLLTILALIVEQRLRGSGKNHELTGDITGFAPHCEPRQSFDCLLVPLTECYQFHKR